MAEQPRHAQAQPSAARAPEPAQPAKPADDDLRPFDPPEGSGQNLSEADKIRLQSESQLAEARRKAEETFNQEQARIRQEHTQKAGAEIAQARETAQKDIEEQRQALRSANSQLPGGLVLLNPAALEIEAGLVRAQAEALQSDETVPNGTYIVAGRLQNAHGDDLGPAPKER